jgi:UDP:flavonoid glycosyltransferase YjiC (YdhE family)
VLEEHGFDLVAWGASVSTVFLHDPELLRQDPRSSALMACGYPYFDELIVNNSDLDRSLEWLRLSDVVIVTLGSFVGMSETTLWARAAEATAQCGVRALFVNARGVSAEFDGTRGHALAVGYVPLSLLTDQAVAVVHHGGLGTTMASIRAGRPAVVVPQAFDQPFNADLVAGAGLGLRADVGTLSDALATVVTSAALHDSVSAASTRLISVEQAATLAGNRILQLAASPDAGTAGT